MIIDLKVWGWFANFVFSRAKDISPVYLPNLTVIRYPVGMIRVLISRGVTTYTCIGLFFVVKNSILDINIFVHWVTPTGLSSPTVILQPNSHISPSTILAQWSFGLLLILIQAVILNHPTF